MKMESYEVKGRENAPQPREKQTIFTNQKSNLKDGHFQLRNLQISLMRCPNNPNIQTFIIYLTIAI